MQDTLTEVVKDTTPLFTNDTIVFGLLMIALGFVFHTSARKTGFWSKYYKIVPALFMAYFIPAIFTSLGLIAPDWVTVTESGESMEGSSNLYYMASRYLLPAALVLMTLSIDLKAVFNLGPKALVMFAAGTIGIIIGGPVAVLIMGSIDPSIVGGEGADAVWRGLSTLAGSWIGGGANQTAMLEIWGYNQKAFGQMVFVDIFIANVWMAVILFGIGKSLRIDRWLKSDTTAIESLKEKVSAFSKSVERNPSSTDLMVLAALSFGAVGISHWCAGFLKDMFDGWVKGLDPGLMQNSLTFLSSNFFWMISIATIIGVLLSFTKLRSYEGAGASKIGGIFIYVLVVTIGMKMDLTRIFENPGLIAVGAIWMLIHAGLLILVAKLIKAPYFFLAVGSQANVGGAASAPVVAAAFHPSLATVGVLLAVVGYAVGTLGAVLCTVLMQMAAPV
ncbi:MAG: DUF819 family protein [Bacteroidota bacterium]